MLISLHDLGDIIVICKKLQRDRIKDLMDSKIHDTDKIRVVTYIEPSEKETIFIRRIERLSTGNYGLEERWSFDNKHFAIPHQLGFERGRMLFDKLEEIK